MTDTLTLQGESKPTSTSGKYTCPMHPEIIKDEAGACPICGMHLVPMQPTEVGEKLVFFTNR
jgi:P-type Cu+ transporter